MTKPRSYVIPMSIKHGRKVVLLGKESVNGDWSGFGGGQEKYEYPKQTAARECFEESMGFMGSKQYIYNHLKRLGKVNYHTFYTLAIEFDPKISISFKQHYKDKSPYLEGHLKKKESVCWIYFTDFKNKYHW